MTTPPTSKPRSDIPTPDTDTDSYWAAAREGKLLIARCADCSRAHHYPRPFCPHCWSGAVTAEEASGQATLYTYSTVFMNDLAPFAERLPYVAAVVELAEGPRVMTNVVGCAPEDLRIGMKLRAVPFPLTDELTATVFRPVDPEGDPV
jgi:Predicted nucleic-acid-binding protein containing a Zn-ribbon